MKWKRASLCKLGCFLLFLCKIHFSGFVTAMLIASFKMQKYISVKKHLLQTTSYLRDWMQKQGCVVFPHSHTCACSCPPSMDFQVFETNPISHWSDLSKCSYWCYPGYKIGFSLRHKEHTRNTDTHGYYQHPQNTRNTNNKHNRYVNA